MSSIGSFEFALSYFREYQIWKYNSSIDKFYWYECMNDRVRYSICKNKWKKEKRIFSFENSFLKF